MCKDFDLQKNHGFSAQRADSSEIVIFIAFMSIARFSVKLHMNKNTPASPYGDAGW